MDVFLATVVGWSSLGRIGAIIVVTLTGAWVLWRLTNGYVALVGLVALLVLRGAVVSTAPVCLGVALTLGGFMCLYRYLRDGEHGWLVLAGGLVGLTAGTAPALATAALAAALPALVPVGVQAWPERRRLVAEWACLAAGAAPGVVLGLLWLQWRTLPCPAPFGVTGSATVAAVARGLWWQTLLVGAVLLPGLLWRSRQNEGLGAAGIGAAVGALVAMLWHREAPWSDLAAALPFYGAGVLIVTGRRWWGERHRALLDARLWLALVLAVYALLVPLLAAAPMTLVPALLLFLATWLHWLPQWAARRGGSALVVRAAALAVLIFAAARYLATMPG